jgi:hypothetical protein
MASIVQVELRSGVTRRTCWVGTDKKFTVGKRITLKNSEDADRLWSVISISEPRDASDVRTDWKVGGL